MDELKVTIFYLKQSGNIHGLWGGSVGFEVFGIDAEAYMLIMDKIAVNPENIPLDINKVKIVNGNFESK